MITWSISIQSSVIAALISMISLCALCQAHPPQKLMKVEFELQANQLVCEVDFHYSQLYPLSKKLGGQVTEKDYPAILRSFALNSSVKIDGVLITPLLTSFERPSDKWGKEHLDHHLDDDELRIARVFLSYPLPGSSQPEDGTDRKSSTTKPKAPERIEITWKLQPRSEDQLAILFREGKQQSKFIVTHQQPSFTWKRLK